MRKIKELINEKSSAANAFDMLPDNSRATRFGKRAIMLGAFVDAAQAPLTAAGVVLLASGSAFAQGSGGSIFGQDQNMVPNAIRQTVIFLSGIAFLFAVAGSTRLAAASRHAHGGAPLELRGRRHAE